MGRKIRVVLALSVTLSSVENVLLCFRTRLCVKKLQIQLV